MSGLYFDNIHSGVRKSCQEEEEAVSHVQSDDAGQALRFFQVGRTWELRETA